MGFAIYSHATDGTSGAGLRGTGPTMRAPDGFELIDNTVWHAWGTVPRATLPPGGSPRVGRRHVWDCRGNAPGSLRRGLTPARGPTVPGARWPNRPIGSKPGSLTIYPLTLRRAGPVIASVSSGAVPYGSQCGTDGILSPYSGPLAMRSLWAPLGFHHAEEGWSFGVSMGASLTGRMYPAGRGHVIGPTRAQHPQ